MYHYAGNNPIKYIDPNGRLNIYGPNINLLPDCEDIKKWAGKEIRPDDIFVIAAHGNPGGIYQYLFYEENSEGQPVRGEGTLISPEKLAQMIKNDPKYRDGMVIELWACNTGKPDVDGTSYAQKLAAEIGEGAVVRAPDSNIWFYFRNQRRLFQAKKIQVEGRIISVEDRTRPGQMLVFIGKKQEKINEEN